MGELIGVIILHSKKKSLGYKLQKLNESEIFAPRNWLQRDFEAKKNVSGSRIANYH